MLRNLVGATTHEELDAAEADLGVDRLVDLRELGPVAVGITPSFDQGHVGAIHRWLFHDVYEWAGQLRTIGMTKDASRFAPVSNIASELDRLREIIAAGADHTDRSAESEYLVKVLGQLNYTHPFREGNGRTQREFAAELAERDGWDLDWSALSRSENDAAFAEAMQGRFDPLREIVDRILGPAVEDD